MKTHQRLTYLLFVSCLLLAPLVSHAETMDLDIIDLKHRNAVEVINIIEPFLVPGASVNSRGYKLIIKSTPENLEEIRKIIAEFDTQLKQLKITVAVGNIEDQQQDTAQANIQIENKTGESKVIAKSGSPSTKTTGSIVRGETTTGNTTVKAQARVKKTTTHHDRPVYQTLTTIEGNWANIQTGQSIPIMERTRNPDGTVTQSMHYQNVASGFSIRPRIIANGKVLIDIRPYQNTLSRHGGGKIDTQSIYTTIEADQNQWVELGGVSEFNQQQTSSKIYRTKSRTSRSESVHVKIEIIQ